MKTKIKAALLDFDGTLVTKDILDLLCRKMGKEAESEQINAAFHRGELAGLSALVKRINFLSGMTKEQIVEALRPNSYLMPGAKELMDFFKKNNIVTILASGNILPVLEYYKQLLKIDYVIGSHPKMNDDTIDGIDESAFSSSSFKTDGIKKILAKLKLKKEQIIALGDSPSDKGMFALSSFAVAVNLKGDIADFADVVVKDDLQDAIKYLKDII